MVEIWFAIFWIMTAVYVILDGRTLGASALRLAVSSNPAQRRQVLDAIGPAWSLYEVWLIAAGGVLLLAFPPVFAAISTSMTSSAPLNEMAMSSPYSRTANATISLGSRWAYSFAKPSSKAPTRSSGTPRKKSRWT